MVAAFESCLGVSLEIVRILMHRLAVFVYRITVSNNIPADLMKGGKKINSNEKDAGLVPAEKNSNFFSSKLFCSPPSLPSASLGGERECDLHLGLPMGFCMCVRGFFFLIK